MGRRLKTIIIVIGVLFLLSLWPACQVFDEIEKAQSDDPTVWEEDIRLLEKHTSGPPGSVVFLGSSSIRLWRTLAEDMSPIPTVRRGFGGAKMADAVHYAARLVTLEKPAAIVVFVGTNDVVPGAVTSAETLLQGYRTLIGNIRSVHAKVPVYYVGITPSPSRWEVWGNAEEANFLIRAHTDADDSLHFIDTGPSLIVDGVPSADYYIFDGLHLSSRGYAIWTDIIKARLLEDLPPRRSTE